MRITNNMLSSQLLLNLNRNAQQMNNTQTQMSTGRKINKPSDDPVGVTYSLRYRSELSANEDYQSNVDSTTSWLDFNDTVLSQTTDVLQRLRELTVQASTGTNSQNSLDSINQEVKQLKEQIIDIGNSQINGKYIFNGQNYTEKPFDFSMSAEGESDTSDPSILKLDTGSINYAVGSSVQLGINVSGYDVFGGPKDKDQDSNVFTIFNNLTAALTSGDSSKIQAQLEHIDNRMNQVMAVQAEVGAKSNRVDLMKNRLTDFNQNLTDLQSKTEDADYSELIVQSKIQENIYNASLSAGSKIIQPSLVDFMR